MSIQYGTRIITFQPTINMAGNLPGLFSTTLFFPNQASHGVNIDTGSVGIVVPIATLQDGEGNFQPWAQPAGETLTFTYEPSGNTRTGPVVVVTGLQVGDGTPQGTTVLGPVRVMACTNDDTVYMLGVGIGLEAKATLTPSGNAATALDNPFLNLRDMLEPDPAVLPAYALTAALQDNGRHGLVTLGQTVDSLQGYRFLPLVADSSSPSGLQLPWVQLTVTPQGGTPIQTQAQMLMDAGITNMFIGVVPEPQPPIPWLNTAITIQAEDEAGVTALNYSFVNTQPADGPSPNVNCDPSQPASPSRILNGGPSPQGGSFLNTGVHLLAAYDYVVDAVNTRLGLRPRS
ncbi:hypothetical protein [Nitrospirillum viridazoti]|uniref:Uncharacterized protein n=1 Tax=Nitrospirillum viridazoti CBAmc TaxID=1441467 RepID=A0A248JZA0_9PROT|nr:hypothetical protein [Nitrospirillum amazonense]ASG23801.1 hypothetical protein Y958_22810 [Nitrospirillum amazonense CBAmc]TWB44784.1 hypothetical protein FBZ91_101255 [Nitrospirillum amazonense]